MTLQPALNSERLLLRELTLDDAPQIQVMAAEKRVSEMTANIPHPYPENAAAEWIKEHKEGWEAGRQATFGIVEKESDAVIGGIGLQLLEANVGELGYWLGMDYWGNGYATEATQSIIKFGFNELNLSAIEACVLTRNPASSKVLLKCGLAYKSTADGNCGTKFESIDYYEIRSK